jgi:hypothetical protein
MSRFSLDLPQDFSDEERWEAKGWFPGARLTVSRKQYHLTFCDPVRLSQDIESEPGRGGVFFEPSLTTQKGID